MYNPEFRFLIANQEMENIEDTTFLNDNLIYRFYDCINIFILLEILLLSSKPLIPFLIGTTYKTIEYVWIKFWESLTPGNQILETVLIVSNLIAFAMGIFVINEYSEIINKKVINLRNENQEKDKIIAELLAKNELKIKN
jgi:hypothetical protein